MILNTWCEKVKIRIRISFHFDKLEICYRGDSYKDILVSRVTRDMTAPAYRMCSYHNYYRAKCSHTFTSDTTVIEVTVVMIKLMHW